MVEEEAEEEEGEDEEDEDEDEIGFDLGQVEPSPRPDQNPVEAMQFDMSDQDIRVGSPDNSSNNLGSNFHHLPVGQWGTSSEHRGYDGLARATTMPRWPCKFPIGNGSFQPPFSGYRLNHLYIDYFKF